MTNTLKRLILFFISIPLLTLLILYASIYNHLGVIVLLTAVGVLCGIELRTLLASVAKPMPVWTVIIPAIPPIMAWTVGMGWVDGSLPIAVLIVAIFWVFIDSLFSKEDELSEGILRMGTRLLMVMYPGWFMWWLARLTWLDNASITIVIFMLAVFLSDSAGWLFGKLFGRHRGIIAVSPNKSIEGYMGCIIASFIVIISSSLIFPAILPHPLWLLLIFSFMMAITASAGDLVESALKRAVGVKDSGTIIFGRGGMLDSIDSSLFAAPVFVFFMELLP